MLEQISQIVASMDTNWTLPYPPPCLAAEQLPKFKIVSPPPSLPSSTKSCRLSGAFIPCHIHHRPSPPSQDLVRAAFSLPRPSDVPINPRAGEESARETLVERVARMTERRHPNGHDEAGAESRGHAMQSSVPDTLPGLVDAQETFEPSSTSAASRCNKTQSVSVVTSSSVAHVGKGPVKIRRPTPTPVRAPGHQATRTPSVPSSASSSPANSTLSQIASETPPADSSSVNMTLSFQTFPHILPHLTVTASNVEESSMSGISEVSAALALHSTAIRNDLPSAESPATPEPTATGVRGKRSRPSATDYFQADNMLEGGSALLVPPQTVETDLSLIHPPKRARTDVGKRILRVDGVIGNDSGIPRGVEGVVTRVRIHLAAYSFLPIACDARCLICESVRPDATE